MVASVCVYNGQKQFHSLSAFVRILCELEDYSYKLSSKSRKKVFQWAERIVQSLSEGGDNRPLAMSYLRLLLDQVQKRHFDIPFDRAPCFDRPLCPLPSSLPLYRPDYLKDMSRQRYECNIQWNRILQQLCGAPNLFSAMTGKNPKLSTTSENDETQESFAISDTKSVLETKNIEYLPRRVSTGEVSHRPETTNGTRISYSGSIIRSDALQSVQTNDHVTQIPYSKSSGVAHHPTLANNTQARTTTEHHDQRHPVAISSTNQLEQDRDGQEKSERQLGPGSCNCCEHHQPMSNNASDYSSHYDRIALIYRESNLKKDANGRSIHRLFQDHF